MKYIHKIVNEVIGGIPVIAVEGDMTSDADADVKKVYAQLTKSFSLDRLIINFEKTKYINSSGIATLINVIQSISEKNGKIAFVGMSDHFRKIMDIVGITEFVQVFQNNDAAAEALGGKES
jgi:anti-anti-sigma factor